MPRRAHVHLTHPGTQYTHAVHETVLCSANLPLWLHQRDRLRPAMPAPSAFGVLLYRLRMAAGLTQEALGERAGVSARAISDLERGERRAPYRETVRLLAEALDLTPAERAQLEAATGRPVSSIGAAPPYAGGSESPGRSLAGPATEPRALPAGTLTFLFTDIEGSTRLWEAQTAAMRTVMARHDALLTAVFEQYGGMVVRPRGEGDSLFAVFVRATGAVMAAVAGQRALAAEDWGVIGPLRVRMAMHTGEADLREGDYYGSAVNRCARIRAAGSGGQILLSQATALLVRGTLPDGMRVRDLGHHRLKDLNDPEALYQLDAAELTASFPPLKVDDRTTLPVPPTSMIGRDADRETIVELLTGNEVRLLTLTGPGGAGKTRLALAVGWRLSDHFRDGVWLVELASLADPALVVPSVAAVIGVKEQSGEELAETLATALAQRSLLLVLDNCEHLLVSSAALVATLLARCPALRVLATSRMSLHVPGETVHPVSPLRLPPAPSALTLAIVQQAEAVQLFVARAQAVRPDFALTDANADAVAQVCRQLDGIPLALELAAARLKALSVGQLAARLADRFRLLTSSVRTGLPHQQTLRATLDWSYQLLTSTEQRLLQRLSVFAGGWTLAAAEQVCAGNGIETEDVLDLLTRLIDHSLVSATDRAEEMQYGMLETVRQYAAARLTEHGGGHTVRDAHLQWYAGMVEVAGPALQGPQAPAWLDRLEREHDNLRAALARATEAASAEVGLRLVAALGTFWSIRGYLAEGRRWLEQFGAAARNPAIPVAVRVRALLQTGHFLHRQGDYAAAQVMFEEGLALARDLGDGQIVAHALRSLGAVVRSQGDYPGARGLLEESLTLARDVGDRAVVVHALRGLGIIAVSQGDYPAARALVEEGLAIARELGNRGYIAFSLDSLGIIARAQGDYPAAQALFEQNLALARELGDRQIVANALLNLGIVVRVQGDYPAAQALFEQSLALGRELGDRQIVANSLAGLGIIARAQGDYPAARTLLEQSLALGRELGDNQTVANALLNLGIVAHVQGDDPAARARLDESLSVQRHLGSMVGTATALKQLGYVTACNGDMATARRLYAESLALGRGLGERRDRVRDLQQFAGVALADGQFVRAGRLLGASAHQLEELGSVRETWEQAAWERDLATVRTALGAAADAAWTTGRAMTLEQATAYGLDGATVD